MKKILMMALVGLQATAATISRTEGSGTWDFNTTWFSKSSGGVKWVSNDNTAKFDLNTTTPAIIRVDNSKGAIAPYRMELQTGNQNWYFEGDPITLGTGGLNLNFASAGVSFSNQLVLTGTTQNWVRASTGLKSDFYGSISGADTDLSLRNGFVTTVQKGFRFFGDNSTLGNIDLWSRGQLHLGYGDTFANKLNPDKTLTLKHGSGLSWYGSSAMTQRVARIRLDDGVGYLQPVTNNAVVLSVDTFQATNGGVLILAVDSSMLWPKVRTEQANLNGILGGWAVIETNNMTSAFATIGADGTLTAFSPVVNNTIASWTATDNVLFSGSITGSGGDYTANSLTIAGTGDLNLGGGTLTLGSGGILRLNTPALNLTNGKLRSGDPQGRLFVHNSNQDLTIAAIIEDNPNGTPTKVIKSGGSGGYTLVLSGRNTLTGGYYVNSGYLTFQNATTIPGLALCPLSFGMSSSCGVRFNNNTPVVMHSVFSYGEPNTCFIDTATALSDITVLNDSYYTGAINVPKSEFAFRSRGNSYFRSFANMTSCTNVLFYGTTGRTNRTDAALSTGIGCRLSLVEGEWWFGASATSPGEVVISNAVADVAADTSFSGKYAIRNGGVFRFGDRARRFSPMTSTASGGAVADNLITIEDGGFLDVWTTTYGVRLGGEPGNNGKKLWIRQKGGKANYGVTRGAQGTETQFRYGYGDVNNSTAAEVGYELAGGEMNVAGTLLVSGVLTGSSFYFDFTGGELAVLRFQSANLLSSALPGTTGVLVNAGGTFSPGLRNAYATNLVVGGYSVISPSAGMYLEVDGGLPAAQDKFIMDTGTAVLGGKLLIDVKGAAVPSSSYDVITANANGTLTGSFDNVVDGKVTTVNGKYVYTVTATDKKITISAPVANEWVRTGGGNWNEGFPGAVPNGSAAEAVFSYGVSANTAVSLTNDVTLATLRLWNQNLAYTIGGASSLNLAAGGKITVGAGSHSITAPVVMGGALTIETLFGEIYDTYGLNVGVSTNDYASKTLYPAVTLFQKYPAYAYVTDVTAPEAFDRITQLQWVYTGYLWNNSTTNETWSFITQFDDLAYLRIDDTWVIGTSVGSSGPTKGTYTLTPGVHYFEVRLGDYGHNGNAGDRWGWGMMYDTLGRNSDLKADYKRWTDVDAGLRFTTTTAKYASSSSLNVSQITGGGALTKTGPGTLVLENAVLGAVALQGGRIVLKPGVVVSESLFVSTGTTVDFTSYEALLKIRAGSMPLGSISAVKDAITAGRFTVNGKVVPTGRFVVSELDGYIRVRAVEGATVIWLR